MGRRPEQEIVELLLGIEDLEEEQLKELQSWLRDHPEAAEHLDRLRAKEELGRDPVPLEEGTFLGDFKLNENEISAEQESLAELREKLGLVRSISPASSNNGNSNNWSFGKPIKWAPWIGALAAILALVIIFPLASRDGKLISNLSVVGLDISGVPVRSGSSSSDQPGVLTSGQAFTLDFHLDRKALVVIYHVDPQGNVGRIFPTSDQELPSPMAGGRSYRFPSPESDEHWILGPETGMESFLIAAHSAENASISGLMSALEQANLSGQSHENALFSLGKVLNDWGAEVQMVEFRHVN